MTCENPLGEFRTQRFHAYNRSEGIEMRDESGRTTAGVECDETGVPQTRCNAQMFVEIRQNQEVQGLQLSPRISASSVRCNAHLRPS